jgi:hypothetical protein
MFEHYWFEHSERLFFVIFALVYTILLFLQGKIQSKAIFVNKIQTFFELLNKIKQLVI